MALKRRQVYCSFAGIPGGGMKMIPTDKYKYILDVLPILCVDIVARNSRGEYLLIKRANEPKKGRWWVIGGRVLKGETIGQAVIRKVKEETGVKVKKMKPIGYFELVAGINPFGLKSKYHTVSVVFEININDKQSIVLDVQSTEFKYAKKLPADFPVKSF